MSQIALNNLSSLTGAPIGSSTAGVSGNARGFDDHLQRASQDGSDAAGAGDDSAPSWTSPANDSRRKVNRLPIRNRPRTCARLNRPRGNQKPTPTTDRRRSARISLHRRTKPNPTVAETSITAAANRHNRRPQPRKSPPRRAPPCNPLTVPCRYRQFLRRTCQRKSRFRRQIKTANRPVSFLPRPRT